MNNFHTELVCWGCQNNTPDRVDYTTGIYFLIVLDAIGPRSRRQWTCFLLRALREGTALVLFVWPSFSRASHHLPYIYVCVHIFSSYKNTTQTGLQPT